MLSIIIPTCNSLNTISDAINSILCQTFTDFELLVIDNCSTDGTLDIIKNYALSYKNIKWISDPDKGIYDAMNKGINLAQGEWIYFMGSDDILLSGALTKVFNNYNIIDFDIVYGDVKRLPSNVIYDGEFDLKKLFLKNICHQAIFTKKKLFNELGNFNTGYKSRADYALNIQAFSKGYKTKYIPVTIAEFYENGISSNYFDINFWNDYKLNYIKPFKGIISRRDRYHILWKLFYHLIKVRKNFFKAFRLWIIISINEYRFRNSILALKQYISNLFK